MAFWGWWVWLAQSAYKELDDESGAAPTKPTQQEEEERITSAICGNSQMRQSEIRSTAADNACIRFSIPFRHKNWSCRRRRRFQEHYLIRAGCAVAFPSVLAEMGRLLDLCLNLRLNETFQDSPRWRYCSIRSTSCKFLSSSFHENIWASIFRTFPEDLIHQVRKYV